MMYQQQVGPTMSVTDHQSNSNLSQHSAALVNNNQLYNGAAGQDLSNRKGMNRQMADFNIVGSGRPATNNSSRLMQQQAAQQQ